MQFVIFFSIFFAVYLSLHFYVFTRLASLFSLENRLYLYIVMAVLALSFPLLSIIERFSTNTVTRIFYAISATWLGTLWFLFALTILFEILKFFIKLDPVMYGMLIVSIAVALTIFSVLNAMFITTKTVQVPIKGLNKDLTIVQLTDMHVGTIHNSGFVKNIVQKINSLKPDIVVITGDLVDSTGEVHKDTYAYLRNIKAPTYFVTGNHEVYAGIKETIAVLNGSDVTILRNRSVKVDGIQLIGMDDPGNSNKHARLEDISYNRSIPTVLLRHQPAMLDDAAGNNISLQLSGHTHDGQLFPFNFFINIFYKYIKGLHEYNGMYLYVSPGTGTWGPPMRLGSRSEITRLVLTPA